MMINPLKVKAVIFDRDGVLIESETLVIRSVRKAFADLGFEFQDSDIPYMIGRSTDVYKEHFLKKWDFDYAEFRRIQRGYFYDNLADAPYFDQAVELVKKLYSQNIPLAVTTSASREGTLLILEKAGIAKLFKTIVTKEDCEKLKPDPEPYILTAKKLELAPETCVALEDTALGVEAAKEAGMLCIAIPNEYTRDQDFSRADAVVQSAQEVPEMLEFAGD